MSNMGKNVALWLNHTPPAYCERLIERIKPCVDTLKVYSFDAAPGEVLDATRYDAVIIVGMKGAPTGAKTAVYRYMSEGGRVMTLGGPTFRKELHEMGGEWLEREECMHRVSNSGKAEYQNGVKKTLLFRSGDEEVMKGMNIGPFNPDHGTSWSVGDYGLEDSAAQTRVQIQKLGLWNTYNGFHLSCDLAGANAIALYARADDDHTESFGVQVQDAEGARWFKVLPLTQQWQLYIIPDSDFTLWKDSRSQRTKPDLSAIRAFQFGYTYDWMRIVPGDHSYCISDVYACCLTLPQLPQNEPGVVIDALVPMTELYPINNAAHLVTHHNQVIVTPRDYKLPIELFSCYAHRQGVGYGNMRSRRFIPLISVKDEKGMHSGYAAFLYLFRGNPAGNGKLDGSMLASFTANSEEFYDENGLSAVIETLTAMLRGCFLVEGGTNEFTYMTLDDQQGTAGVSYTAFGSADAAAVTSSVSLYEGDRLLTTYTAQGEELELRNENIYQHAHSFDFADGRPTRAVASLMMDGQVIDRIEQEVFYWQPKPLSERKYVYIEDGYFKRDGKIVNMFGVNYGLACRAGHNASSGWLGRADYDPEIVEDDFARLEEVGFNAVALWASTPTIRSGNTILDLLRRCENHGFYVDMAMNTDFAYPLRAEQFKPDQIEPFIKRLHMDEMDFITAYDIEWEPRVGTYRGAWNAAGESKTMTNENRFNWPGFYVGRQCWDADWAKWIDVQYGSLENAERSWECTLDKTPEGYPYVSDAILDDTSGKYGKMLAAYYRFIDDQVATTMADGMAYLRSLAPNQLFSFRMSMSGSGHRTPAYYPSIHCFDFQSLAPVVDFMAPEGYALNSSPLGALQLPVANAYARYTAPNMPVVWKEYGWDCCPKWEDYNFCPDIGLFEQAGVTAEITLKNMYRAYTSASYYWWSVSGFRTDEKSDCGLYDPDGTDRPVAKVLRKYAPLFKNQGERPRADVLIEVERDNQVGQIYGIFGVVQQQALKVWNEGKSFDFVNATQKGFDQMAYADENCAAAVGGASEQGLYPLRYVNGIVKDLELVEKNGRPVALVTVCNTKQTIWRAGTVCLTACPSSEVKAGATIDQDVGYLENVIIELPVEGKGKLDLRLEIKGLQFGPKYTTEIK